MKKILFLAMLLVFMGCEKHNHNESAEHHEHHHIHSFVAYTDNMELFLQHEGLEAGKKSYAVSFILQDTEKTLADKQIDAVMNKIITKG